MPCVTWNEAGDKNSRTLFGKELGEDWGVIVFVLATPAARLLSVRVASPGEGPMILDLPVFCSEALLVAAGHAILDSGLSLVSLGLRFGLRLEGPDKESWCNALLIF